jgi:Chaperone of endosialidase
MSRIPAIIVLVVVTAVLASAAAAGQKGEIAEVSIGTGGIVWHPAAAYPGLSLTVAMPDGQVVQETFAAGIAPSLDLSGGNLLDGQYTWELRVVAGDTADRRGDTEDRSETMSSTVSALTQTGSFRVSQGVILVPSGAEESATKLLHTEDTYIDGNLRIGNDIVGTEAFPFDTFLMKANNLRIYFDDTSGVLPGFPENDWRIIVNDTTDGGADYFAIEDSTADRQLFRVEAGAPANSLYVDDEGSLGLGTSTPAMDLHVVCGDSPTIRLDQQGGAYVAQAWDILGNDAGFSIRDVTSGTVRPFKIEPGAPSNALFVQSDGHIGMGTELPAWPLTVRTTGEAATLVLDRTDGALGYINAGGTYVNIGTGTPNHLRFMVNGAWKAQINTDGSLHMASGASCSVGGVWTNSSSRELKDDIERISAGEAMEALAGLDPVKYHYKTDKTDAHVGFIAEDVPDLVATKDRKGMSPMDVTAVLTKVVQEQQKVIAELRTRVETLEAQARQ